MKFSKSQKRWVGLFLLILVIAFLGLRLSFSILGIEYPQRQTAIWDGRNVEIESPYFGDLANGKLPWQTSNQEGGSCGFGDYRADGRTSIRNHYQNSTDFILDSLTESGSFACSFNYMESKVILPAGNLTIICDTWAIVPSSFGACEVKKINSLISSEIIFNSRSDGVATERASLVSHNIITQEIILSKSTEFIFKVSNGVGDRRSLPSYFPLSNGFSNLKIHFEPEQINIPEPIEPRPRGFLGWLSQLDEWISDFFKKLFGLSITGNVNIEPGTLHTYNINLQVNPIFSNNTYRAWQWGSWGVVDPLNNIIQGSSPESVNGSYVKSVTITTPLNVGDYALVGIIEQATARWDRNNGKWIYTNSTVINKEAINLKNEYSITEPIIPLPSGLSKLIQAIKNFFCGAFGWFCS